MSTGGLVARQDDYLRLASDMVCDLLPHGLPAKSRVARNLGLHERTLLRRLRERGYTYKAVLDTVRFERCSAYIAEGRSLQEISDLLGFADKVSFHRAFKRWTGTTPGSYANARGVGPICDHNRLECCQ